MLSENENFVPKENLPRPAESETKESGQPELWPQIEPLWRQFGFPGAPPRTSSTAYKRLFDKCDEYMTAVIKGDTDSSFANIKGYDGHRRTLHNEIAVMILGKPRNELDDATADGISDFASRLVYNCPLPEASKFFKHNSDE